MDNLEYIKKFSKINISQTCRKVGVDRANLLNKKANKDNARKVREEIESQIAMLYVKSGDIDGN